MALFYCVWPDEASWLVDVLDVKAARAAALEHVGTMPTEVRAIPEGVFACDVHFEPVSDEDGEDGDDEVHLEISGEHVADALFALEDELTPDETPRAMCMSEADVDGGGVVRCELEAHGKRVKHSGGGCTWTDAP